ncbi:MAG: GNAT family N-acetyltransferase [Thermoplasmatota archaeon]
MKRSDRITIRNDLRPGDIGYLIDLHDRLYREEYGFDDRFKEYVAETFHDYLENRVEGSDRDRFWIVERDGEIVGSVAVVERSEDLAQLRWLLLHPDVRRKGIARKITAEALDFARERGYRSIYLTTQDILEDAARLYDHFGFRITEEEINEIWGLRMNYQRYDLEL